MVPITVVLAGIIGVVLRSMIRSDNPTISDIGVYIMGGFFAIGALLGILALLGVFK